MTKKQLFYLFLAFLIGLGLTKLVVAQTQIKGPEQTRTGTLTIFEITPTQGADWSITPTAGTPDTFQVDSSGDKLYFASPNAGVYTIVAAIVVEGKPQLLTHAFVNTGGDVKPSPDPPEPNPTPDQALAIWIKSELPKLVKSKNLAQERLLVAQSFRETVQKIDAGTIKNAQNARTQLQISLTMTLAFASDAAIDEWQSLLTELSKKMADELGGKVNDVNSVKSVFEQVSSVLGELAPLTVTPVTNEINCPTCQPQQYLIQQRALFQRFR